MTTQGNLAAKMDADLREYIGKLDATIDTLERLDDCLGRYNAASRRFLATANKGVDAIGKCADALEGKRTRKGSSSAHYTADAQPSRRAE